MAENNAPEVKLNENPEGTVSFATDVVATIAGLAANEVEGVAAAEGQGQDAVENKQGAALRHGEKYDACYEVEQQIYRIKYGLHNIGHFGLIGFVIHVFILSV